MELTARRGQERTRRAGSIFPAHLLHIGQIAVVPDAQRWYKDLNETEISLFIS